MIPLLFTAFLLLASCSRSDVLADGEDGMCTMPPPGEKRGAASCGGGGGGGDSKDSKVPFIIDITSTIGKDLPVWCVQSMHACIPPHPFHVTLGNASDLTYPMQGERPGSRGSTCRDLGSWNGHGAR
jgi:hypothetical protein